MSFPALDKEELLNLVLGALKDEMARFKENLTDEQVDALKDVITGLAEERIALALADDPDKKEYHRTNLKHYEAAFMSVSGIARLKAYDSAISLSGRILAGVLLATGKALLP
jgi:hypothetical protein